MYIYIYTHIDLDMIMDYLSIMVTYKQDLSNENGICIFCLGGEYQGIYYGTYRGKHF